MRAGLFIIPFIAILIGAIGTAVASSFPTIGFISPAAWGISLLSIIIWVALDFENFRKFFNRRGSKYGASSGLYFVMGIIIIAGVGKLTNKPRFNKTWDVTQEGINTLSDQSVKLVESIKKFPHQIEIKAFLQDDPVKDNFKRLLKLYQLRGAEFKVEYIDPSQDPTKALAEKISSANTVIFKTPTQEARITTFNEEKMTNAMVSILKEKTKKIYFTKGHAEARLDSKDPDGLQMIVDELKNNKYEVEALSILKEAKIPEDADLVVIAGPKYEFQIEEVQLLEDYLKNGGSLFVAIDAIRPLENLNDLLVKFGLRYESDLLIMSPDDPRAAFVGQNNAIISDFDELNPVSRDFAKQGELSIIIPSSRSISKISDSDYQTNVTIAAKTADIMVQIKDVYGENDLKDIADNRIETGGFNFLAVAAGKSVSPEVAQKTEDNKKSDVDPQTTSISSKKEIRIVAAGSSHFARNRAISTSVADRDLFLNISNYLLQDEDFISIRPKDFAAGSIDITTGTSQLLLLSLSYIYPFFFLFGGLAFWLKRRNA